MAQQTAVEWLDNELWKLRLKLRGVEISLDIYCEQEVKLIEQAKEMEKEQIVIAHGTKSNGRLKNDGQFIIGEITGEQYYNETYNK